MTTQDYRSVVIRTATGDDLPAVQALFAAHLTALGLTPDPILDADMAAFPDSYVGLGAAFLVGENPDGQVVAMAGRSRGEIRRLHVREPWRGQGLARRLVMALIESGACASPGPLLRAIVARANHGARRVFEACGFVPSRAPRMAGVPAHCDVLELASSDGAPWGMPHELLAPAADPRAGRAGPLLPVASGARRTAVPAWDERFTESFHAGSSGFSTTHVAHTC